MKTNFLLGYAAALSLILLLWPDPLRAISLQNAAPELKDVLTGNGETEALIHYKQKRLPEGENEIPAERYLTARERMQEMAAYYTSQDRFRNSNDFSSLNTQATWAELGPGNIGGRTRALVIHPTDANTMYTGAASGGVWKTTDGGSSWKPLTDLLANLAVNSLAIDTTNPNVIFAGTGEGYFNTGSIRGAGIFKTIDGGANWVRLTATAGPDFYYVNDLIISPLNNQRIYAATNNGVWRSLDGGTNWERILEIVTFGGCLDLAIRTDQSTDYIFAAIGQFQSGTVLRNKDAGGSGNWETVLQESGMTRTSLAISQSNQNIIYASASGVVPNTQIGLLAIFRSDNGGDSWTAKVRANDPKKLNTVLFSWTLDAFRQICRIGPERMLSTGWYSNSIAVDPLDPNRVWVGGVDLFRSDDGGANWGLASYSWLDADQPQYAHAHHHKIVFHPHFNGADNRTMIVVGDGGIYKTDDARAATATNDDAPCDPSQSLVRWTTLNRNYAATQFIHGAVTPDGQNYIGGAAGFGFLSGSDEGGANGWRHLIGNDGGYVVIDPAKPSTIYTLNTGGLIRKSTDGGKTFAVATNWLFPSGFPFGSPIVADPSDAGRLWTAGNSLWRTTNGASDWTQVGLAFQSSFSAIAVSPTDSNFVLAGNTSGQIWRLPNALNSSIGTTSSPRSGYISWLVFDPIESNIVYATYSTFGGKHVWRSLDGGQNWLTLDGVGTGALPDVPVHCLVVDPVNRRRLFIGTDVGVFVSLDGGVSWAMEMGLPNVTTESLAINTTVNGKIQLFAFTYGRGVWRVDLGMNSCLYSLSRASIAVSPNGGVNSVSVTTSNGCHWSASVNPNSESWIKITGDNNGNGNDSVSFSVEPNLTEVKRFGSIAIAGRSFTIEQDKLTDTIAPKIKILTPTEKMNWTTTSSSVVLSGIASDNVDVARITWKIDRSGKYQYPVPSSGYAFGTDDWFTEPIVLPKGYSTISLIVTDTSGLTTQTRLQILRLPASSMIPIAGNGEMQLNGNNLPALTTAIGGVGDMTMDRSGNLYYVDLNNRLIRKFNLNNGLITTIAGGGSQNRVDNVPATQTDIGMPARISFDPAGNLYILESVRIRKISVNGIITTIAGGDEQGFAGDGGPAAQARFNNAKDLKIDSNGNIYISDSGNTRVRKIDATTGIINTIAGNGVRGLVGDGGPATQAQLGNISYLALDSANNLYISDSGNHAVRKVAADSGIITTVAGKLGSVGYDGEGGPANQAMLQYPSSLAFDSANNLYIADPLNFRIFKVSADSGIINTFVENQAIKSENISALVLQVDSVDTLLIGLPLYIYRLAPFWLPDQTPPSIRLTEPRTTTVQLANVGDNVSLRGTATDNIEVTHLSWSNDRGGGGLFSFCCGLDGWQFFASDFKYGVNSITVTAWDTAGNSASVNLKIIAPDAPFGVSGVIRTFAGNKEAGYSGDGGASAAAQLWSPEGIAFDTSGNLYIADSANHRIRKVGRDGRISTFAGNGLIGSGGDGGTATEASLSFPTGVAADGNGNVYIADSYNNRIRKVAPNGVISTVAGSGVEGFGGDGAEAINARLNTPNGITVDSTGNIYFSDFGNHRVRRIDSGSGLISTVAGKGYGFAGDGGSATAALLSSPRGVTVDASGNLYIADSGNLRVRKVTPSGIINTVVGNGQSGSPVNGALASDTPLRFPSAVTVDASGNLILLDRFDSRVYRITSPGFLTFLAGSGGNATPSEEGTPALSGTLGVPSAIALDRAGNIYVSDLNTNRVLIVANYGTAASVSAASYLGKTLASDSIAAVFGTDLAITTQIASGLPLPTSLAGTSVRVRDNQGTEQLAPLFFVSPSQINFLLPPGLANGEATVIIQNLNGHASTSTIEIAATAPGLFTANSSGQGAAIGEVLRLKIDGRQIYEPIAVYDQSQKQFVTRSIHPQEPGERLFLILYGTGLRNNDGLSKAKIRIAGEELPVLYAGAQGSFVGLDQINVEITEALFNRGEVDLSLIIGEQQSNTIRVKFGEKLCDQVVMFQAPAPNNSNFNGSGGTAIFNVQSNSGCGWYARSETEWVTPLFSNPQFAGSASLHFRVAPNPTLSPRAGTVRIAGQVFTINQEAASSAESPILTITSPNPDSTYLTQASSVSLKGTASAIPGLAFIYWNNDRGSSGYASGLGDWHINDVILQAGINKLNVKAYDLLGRSRSLLFTVNFKPEWAINTVAGGGSITPSNGVPATSVSLTQVNALAVSPTGDLFIADETRLLRVSSDGTLNIAVGNSGTVPGSISRAGGLYVDQAGNLYFTDLEQNCLRKADFTAKLQTTIAGKCRGGGFAGDGGIATSAQLNQPNDVILDALGNVYIADTNNNRIRKVDATTGIITTIAGNGSEMGDLGDGGPALSARITRPSSIAFGKDGLLYVCSGIDNRIRKINLTTGIITTFAGGGANGLGEGGPALDATINPYGMGFDSESNLYLTDSSRIRQVSYQTGIIKTIAGTGTPGYSGDGGPALLAQIQAPRDVVVDSSGNIYIAEAYRIRKLTPFPETGIAPHSNRKTFNQK